MLSLSSRLTWPNQVGAEVAAHHVAAQRQRQPRLLLPPHAEIDDEVQPLILERQLPLVDDKPRVIFSFLHRLEDLVEGQDFVGEPLRQQQAQGEERRGQRAGHGDAGGLQFLNRHRPAGDDHRPVAVAHAATAGQQGVLVEEVGVGVDADGGEVEFAAEGAAVERLDVLQLVA